MAFTGSGHGLSFEVESSFGTRTGTAMQLANITSTDLGLQKSTFTSETLRPDQMIPGVTHGQKSISGTISAELEHGGHNDWIAASVGGTWAQVTTGAVTDVGVTSVAGEYTSSTTDWTDYFEVGDVITITGFTEASNNLTDAVVTSVTATVLTFSAETTVVEASGDSVTFTAAKQEVKGGTAQPSYTIERRFIDNTGASSPQYQLLTGCTFNGMSMTFDNDGIVTVSYDLLGQDSNTSGTSTDATPLAASTNDPMTVVNATLKINGVANSVVKSVDFNLTRNMETNPVVGRRTTPFITPGRNTVTGTATVLFEDSTMVSYFEDATEVSMQIRAGDDSGNYMDFYIPALKFSSADNPVNSEGVIELSMSFDAYLSDTENTNLIITRSS